jgi:DNA/RNA endonuclease YhcR with UshA esterase domain
VAQTPTPGTFNTSVVPNCVGGAITELSGISLADVCAGQGDGIIELSTDSSAPGDAYIFILADENGNIVEIISGTAYDLTTLPIGNYQIYGLAYSGTLDPLTTAAGLAVSGISGASCLSFSENILPVIVNDCSATSCSGGTVSFVGGSDPAIVCLATDNAPLGLTFTSVNPGTFYTYVIADENDNILQFVADEQFDFDAFAAGTYHIWGLSYNGVLDPLNAAIGLAVIGISASECASLSNNFLTVNMIDCNAVFCDGGSVTNVDGRNYFVYCLTEPGTLSLAHTNVGDAPNYDYFVADAQGNIVEAVIGSEFSTQNLTEGQYFVYGVAYDGTLDASTTAVGAPVSGIASLGDCAAVSTNTTEIQITACDVVEGCTDLFISEYLEGVVGSTKAIEVFNPTNFPVNLEGYMLFLYSNGNTNFNGFAALQGVLPAGETYVVANFQSVSEVLALAQDTSAVCNFNGNDAIELRRNDVVIDVIGVVGTDPGSAWEFGDQSTSNQCLVRKPDVHAGTTNWIQSTSQWISYVGSDFSHLGNHNFNPCSTVPVIGFEVGGQTVEENAGSAFVDVTGYNLFAPVTVTVNVVVGNATADEDYQNIFPVTLSFEAGTSTQTIEIPIIDDLIEESLPEYFTIELTSANEVIWTLNQHSVTIQPSDPSFPIYTIAEVSGMDVTGAIDSLNVSCELRGIVHGINFNSSGIHFTLNDGTDAIKVFSALQNFGYTVEEGDSVHVGGTITQFQGQQEIRPDYIDYIDGGHALESIAEVSGALNEEMESHLVRVRCVAVTSPIWETTGGGFYAQVSDGTNTYSVRIDGDANFFGETQWLGHFDLVGIVEQTDLTSPLNSDYNIWPRYTADRENPVIASYATFTELEYNNSGAVVNFDNTSVGAISYNWTFGDGASSTDENPTHQYTFAWLSDNPVFTIGLQVTSAAGCSDEFIFDVNTILNSILEQQTVALAAYPNPTKDVLVMKAQSPIRLVELFDLAGRKVLSQGVNAQMQFTFDMSALSTGMYRALVTTEGGMSVISVVKE